MRTIVLISLFFGFSSIASGFTFLFDSKDKLQGGQTTFFVNIPGVAPSGVSWNSAFATAVTGWNLQTPVTISISNDYIDPCTNQGSEVLIDIGDDLNGVDFSPNICWWEFGNRSAISLVESTNNKLIEGDILFNSNLDWDIYDGPLRSEDEQEFKRVAVHEIGHVLGLDHSIFDGSIMSVSANDTYILTPDDSCGVAILYGNAENCSLLKETTTISGNESTALFVGGVSSDAGMTYASSFNNSEILNVMVTVVVEDDHIGMSGQIFVVAVLPGDVMYAKTEAGGFAAYTIGSGPLPTAVNGTLRAANELYILKDFVPLGLDATLQFYIGYSLASNPEELYFTANPIEFTVGPTL